MKTGSGVSMRRHGAGFTYMGLLLAIVGAALAVSAGSRLLGNDLRRDREDELLAVGDEIRRAIESYHAKNNGGMNPFPRRLEWLLKDPNQPTTQRYLRRVYRDPMADRDTVSLTEAPQWGTILDVNGQIVGVHSLSTREPLKTGNFPKLYESFREAKRYSDWRFIAAGGVAANPAAAAAASGRNFIPGPGAPTLLAPPVAAGAAARLGVPGTPVSVVTQAGLPGVPQLMPTTGQSASAQVSLPRIVAEPPQNPSAPLPESSPATTQSVTPSVAAAPPRAETAPPPAVPAESAPVSGAAGAAPAASTAVPSAPAAGATAAASNSGASSVPNSFTTTPQSFVIRPPSGF